MLSFYSIQEIICDHINSLAMHPNQTTIATGQIGKKPFICIWDAIEMKTLSLLKDQHTHGVASIAFSSSGEVKPLFFIAVNLIKLMLSLLTTNMQIRNLPLSD